MDFIGNQDFSQNQLQNAVVHVSTSFPVSPLVGQLIFRSDTTPKKLWIFLGLAVPGTTDGWFDLTHAYYA